MRTFTLALALAFFTSTLLHAPVARADDVDASDDSLSGPIFISGVTLGTGAVMFVAGAISLGGGILLYDVDETFAPHTVSYTLIAAGAASSTLGVVLLGAGGISLITDVIVAE